ncbi:MAG TPA: helix-turn-helix transcriptional regulator, partial [Candidatus Baltobacteraceae bacterium]|nr:helix-turn-helix transcriptional regulator [Candidatus Baltobacteraceae bacterium]
MKPENLEFIRLFNASGWSQAEVARKLELDRSSPGKFLKGKAMPSTQTLKLFKLILADENPSALTGALESREGAGGEYTRSEDERILFEELRSLKNPEDVKRIVNAMRAMAVGLPKRDQISSGRALARKHIGEI